MSDRFAAFILTHGRPDRVKTYDTLRRQGYTGEVYIIIDNEDSTGEAYRKRFGSQVVIFDKTAIAETFDECDNFNIGRKSVVYARNACFDIAQELGITYFLQLDDDYHTFEYRFTPDFRPSYYRVNNLDQLFAVVLDFYKSIPAKTVALAQGGDRIGGAASQSITTLRMKRKAMNTFFCSIDRPFQFVGRINEDVNTYVMLGHRGDLFLTIYQPGIVQETTQTQTGGMTDIYQDSGTYVKSFYPVMLAPSCVRVYEMGETRRRIHHKIDWSHAVPVIISEQYRRVE